MKRILHAALTMTVMIFSVNAFAGASYNITQNTTWNSNSSIPNPCFDCTFNISNGVTLTIETDVTFQNVEFNGGSVIIDNKKVTLWTSKGGPSEFKNTSFRFKKNSSLIGSAPIILTNSKFRFEDESYMNPQHTLDVINSQLQFVQNAYFEATGSEVNLKNSSLVTVGDGTLASKAYFKVNGSNLNIYDNSAIRMANKNNYYFNWSDYTSKVTNKKIRTTDNNLNCGGTGVNACSPPMLFGPSLINGQGFGVASILPVKLIDFDVKTSSNNSRILTWSTETEVNAAEFVIEVSTDTKQWSSIATVKAAGSSSTVINYNVTDASKRSGVVNYRLKMVDLDGQYSYSFIKMIDLGTNGAQEVSVYPNPATSYVMIATKNRSQVGSSVQIINQNGLPVYNAKLTSSNTNISLRNFTPGNYIVRIINNDGTGESFKILVTGK